jgi:hypothetical protein
VRLPPILPAPTMPIFMPAPPARVERRPPTRTVRGPGRQRDNPTPLAQIPGCRGGRWHPYPAGRPCQELDQSPYGRVPVDLPAHFRAGGLGGPLVPRLTGHEGPTGRTAHRRAERAPSNGHRRFWDRGRRGLRAPARLRRGRVPGVDVWLRPVGPDGRHECQLDPLVQAARHDHLGTVLRHRGSGATCFDPASSDGRRIGLRSDRTPGVSRTHRSPVRLAAPGVGSTGV